MSKVRCVRNVQLSVVDVDGVEKQEVFAFGNIYGSKTIEVVDNNYINIIFADGRRVDGVNKNVFENYQTPVVEAMDSLFVENTAVEAPQSEEDENIIPMVGDILSEDEYENYEYEDDSEDDPTYGLDR